MTWNGDLDSSVRLLPAVWEDVKGLLRLEFGGKGTAPAGCSQESPGRDGKIRDLQAETGQRVRLQGIGAPERKQACRRAGQRYQCGAAATQVLHRRIGVGAVTCTILELFSRSMA